jgi:glycosyltransferase involved in cell wall biosynthesis
LNRSSEQNTSSKLKVGVANEETWAFFNEIYASLQAKFRVTLFQRPTSDIPVFQHRLNRFLFERNLRKLLQNNEVVFFEWASELLSAATHQPKTCGIVVRLHRYEMYRWVDKINWQAVDRLIVVTEAKKNEFLERFPSMNGRVVVIPEAVSLERFTPFAKPFSGQIGTLCSLIPRKRVYELILAFAELHDRHPSLHLHVAGPERDFFAEYAAALYHLVKKLGLQEAVTFYGRIQNPEEWYRKLDIFVSNSYSEGLQVALLEAMACGVYSLSHAWDGAEELLPPDHLFFSEAELLSKIEDYLELPESAQAEKRQLMQSLVAKKSDIQCTIQRIQEVISEVGAAFIPGKQPEL